MRYRTATRRIRAAEIRARHRRAEAQPASYRQLAVLWRQLTWEIRNSRRRLHYRAVEIHIFHKKPFLPPRAISCKIFSAEYVQQYSQLPRDTQQNSLRPQRIDKTKAQKMRGK